MMQIDPNNYKEIVFFTGAGMSAESGVPTYRGKRGIWNEYKWEEHACQAAFERNPQKVLKFHELRRQAVLECEPHAGHYAITEIESKCPQTSIVTQNIDGMHQRAGTKNVSELHGSLWRLRCPVHGVIEDIGKTYKNYTCEKCNHWLRPEIIWFNDMLDQIVMDHALVLIGQCNLFISIGTSGVVWPAAGFPQIAKANNAYCIEINPEPSEMSTIYDEIIRKPASEALTNLFL